MPISGIHSYYNLTSTGVFNKVEVSAQAFFFLNLKGILIWHSMEKKHFIGQLENSV